MSKCGKSKGSNSLFRLLLGYRCYFPVIDGLLIFPRKKGFEISRDVNRIYYWFLRRYLHGMSISGEKYLIIHAILTLNIGFHATTSFSIFPCISIAKMGSFTWIKGLITFHLEKVFMTVCCSSLKLYFIGKFRLLPSEVLRVTSNILAYAHLNACVCLCMCVKQKYLRVKPLKSYLHCSRILIYSLFHHENIPI